MPRADSLRHAVAEVALIFVGVGLALIANDWNQNRLERIQERQLLTQLRDDLLETQRDLTLSDGSPIPNGDLPQAEAVLAAHGRIIVGLMRESTIDWRAAAEDMDLVATGGSGFFPQTAGYESLKSAGIDIVRSDALRVALTNFFELTLARVAKAEDQFRESRDRYLIPYVAEHFRLLVDPIGDGSEPGFRGLVPRDAAAVERDPAFLFVLRRVGNDRQLVLRFYHRAARELRELLALLERELGA